MALRHHYVTIYPRIQVANSRGALTWVEDRENAVENVKVGITAYETTRAEVRGDVELETIDVRLPWTHKGRPLTDIGPGAMIVWDGSDWDMVAPPKARATRVRSVRHYTVQCRRRPYTEGRRD